MSQLASELVSLRAPEGSEAIPDIEIGDCFVARKCSVLLATTQVTEEDT